MIVHELIQYKPFIQAQDVLCQIDIYVFLTYNKGVYKWGVRWVRIISKKQLREFYHKHSQAEVPLTEWYYKMKEVKVKNINMLRKVFNSVDPVGSYTVFNIGGNNYRLISVIHYNTQCCYVREIWTHAQYSKRTNQDKLVRGRL